MTIIASEIERFNRLGATWWNSAGPMRPLHVINELRLEYLRQLMAQQFTCAAPSNLAGLRVLDIGCGAGLLCEPLARSGAQVTGIDAAARNVAAARIHAASQSITIDYRVGDPAAALRPDELKSAASRAGLALTDLRGMRYLPLIHRTSWVRDTSVNYIAAFARADATPSRFTLRQR